jgi:hypothetical protein
MSRIKGRKSRQVVRYHKSRHLGCDYWKSWSSWSTGIISGCAPWTIQSFEFTAYTYHAPGTFGSVNEINLCTDNVQAGRGQITKLALHNWEFPNIGSLTKVIRSAAHLKVLTLTCCSFLSSEGPTPPFERLALKAIDILEFWHSQLMRDTLRWVAEVSLTLTTLKIESDDQQYLTYILDNRLDLSVEKFCLVII